jgi:hypothetical protein
MAIRTREEIMTALNTHLGDDHSDEALALVEDITDTLESLSGSSGGVNWEQRYRDNDAAWREKYRNRFFGKGDDNDGDNDNDNDNPNKNNKPRTFADLFRK